MHDWREHWIGTSLFIGDSEAAIVLGIGSRYCYAVHPDSDGEGGVTGWCSSKARAKIKTQEAIELRALLRASLPA